MPRPTVTVLTERVYAEIPEYLREQDGSDDTWQMLRFLSLLVDEIDPVRVLAERIDYVPISQGGVPGDSSELVDPLLADEAWLPWLGQLLGVHLTGLSGQAARDAVAGAVNGYRVGTKGAIADAARSALTGSRSVAVYDHSVSSPGDGGVWDVLIVTRSGETPDVPAVLAAVVAKGAKPAGVTLHHRAYTSTWAQMEAAYGPTWADRNDRTWAELQEAGL